MTVDYAIVFFLGAGIGVTELVSRYRDEPWKALLNLAALLYLTINGVAACAALLFIDYNGWNFGIESEAKRLWQLSVAGFGAMTLFRSALFNVRVGDADVAVGPSAFLTIILNAADRSVDRARGGQRARTDADIMRGVDFVLARIALPSVCFALMQRVTAEEQQQCSEQIEKLALASMDPRAKTLVLGLLLMNIVGEEVLSQAVQVLGETIKQEAAT